MQKKNILFIVVALLIGFLIGYYFGLAEEKDLIPIYIHDTPTGSEEPISSEPYVSVPDTRPTMPSSPPNSGTMPVACTMDAKMCPDGSYVGRQGPNCEFAKCPGEI